MATTTFLSNITTVTVNAVDLSDQCTAIVFTNMREQLDKSTLKDTSRLYTGGLYNNECTMTLFQSYAASETYQTLASLVGTATTVVATVTEGAVTKTFTLSNTYLESMPVVNGALGELSTVDLSFTGGTFVAS